MKKLLLLAASFSMLFSCAKDGSKVDVNKSLPTNIPTVTTVDFGSDVEVLWATANVGASKDSDRGLNFVWGEREIYTATGWETYKYCNGTALSITKYCTLKSFGNVDGLKSLELNDDPASLLGEGWRTPSEEEWKALLKFDWKYVENYENTNVPGYLVSRSSAGPNAKIFLPLTIANAVSYEGLRGCYWANTIRENDCSIANCLFLDKNYKQLDAAVRYVAYPVRAVKDKKK